MSKFTPLRVAVKGVVFLGCVALLSGCGELDCDEEMATYSRQLRDGTPQWAVDVQMDKMNEACGLGKYYEDP